MDAKDLEAEIHPLKHEAGPPKGSPERPAPGPEAAKGPAPRSRLSRCRAVAFFLALFLCLAAVFVVSFVIPCPERPVFQGTWTAGLGSAVAYDFLATRDVNRDALQDVLVLYKKHSGDAGAGDRCADEGFSSPCTFMAAVSGANGSVLWERPAAQDAAGAWCNMAQPGDRGPAATCVLVGRSGSLLALDAVTGATLWRGAGSLGRNATVRSPPLPLPDLDADGAPDLLVLSQEGAEVKASVYSGSTGRQVGVEGSLGAAGPTDALLFMTRTGAHYVLLPCASSLCGYSVKGLYETATGRDGPLRRDTAWEAQLNASTHGLPWQSSGAVRHLMLVPGKLGTDLLLVSTRALVLLDGQELAPRWTLDAAQVLRKPVLGRYKPDTLAVAVENGTGSDRQILLLDGSTGALLWSQALPGLPGAPPSASLPTADRRSAFFFWGLHASSAADPAAPAGASPRLYLLHPSLPGVLLELPNASADVVAFRAVLLEPGRHAACILLTGPAGPDAPGPVSVSKYRVRDLVPGSKVVRLAAGGRDSDQAIRDRFSRLRFQSEA